MVGVSSGSLAYVRVPGVQYLKPAGWCGEYCSNTFGVSCSLFNALAT